jgi:phosphohistidine phosphatase
VFLYLVHHGEAVGPGVDPRRPLSPAGHAAVVRLATEAARRGVRPVAFWHSGKLRAKQTAEEFWRACNALAELSASRDLQPDDPPAWMRDRLRGETRDILIAGHFPHLPRLAALLRGEAAGSPGEFPPHGLVAFYSDDVGSSWREMWRIETAPPEATLT